MFKWIRRYAELHASKSIVMVRDATMREGSDNDYFWNLRDFLLRDREYSWISCAFLFTSRVKELWLIRSIKVQLNGI